MRSNELILVPILLHISDLRDQNNQIRRLLNSGFDNIDIERATDQWEINQDQIAKLWTKYNEIYSDLQLNKWHASQFISVYGPITGPVVFRYIAKLREENLLHETD